MASLASTESTIMASAKDFVIYGFPIAKSKSPILHNTAFAHHGLPHKYRIVETQTLDESVRATLRAPNFGGASVTMPHKLKIREFLDEVTPVAELLGAVNTVIPVQQSDGSLSLLGDNTDWIGLRDQVLASIEPGTPLKGQSGLVLGAGGAGRAAVYAMHQLGISPIYLYNRTKSRAEEIQSEFPADYGIQVLSSLDSRELIDNAPTVVIGTLPASVTSTEVAPNENGIFIPRQCVEQARVVIDMAYLPRETPLIRLAHALTADSPDRAIAVGTGLDVLLQQGFEQFRLWTGLEAPKEECRGRVVAEYERENPL